MGELLWHRRATMPRKSHHSTIQPRYGQIKSSPPRRAILLISPDGERQGSALPAHKDPE